MQTITEERKGKKKWYEDTSVWEPEFKEMFDTTDGRKHSGRRMSIFINKPRIRHLLHNNKHSQK